MSSTGGGGELITEKEQESIRIVGHFAIRFFFKSNDYSLWFFKEKIKLLRQTVALEKKIMHNMKPINDLAEKRRYNNLHQFIPFLRSFARR